MNRIWIGLNLDLSAGLRWVLWIPTNDHSGTFIGCICELDAAVGWLSVNEGIRTKLFDYFEANAESFWEVPRFELAEPKSKRRPRSDDSNSKNRQSDREDLGDDDDQDRLDEPVPQNDGIFRCVDVIAPKGTIFNPNFPRACFSRFNQCQRVVDNTIVALSKVVPDLVTAGNSAAIHFCSYAGFIPEKGEYWLYLEVNEGSYGGRKGRDGMDSVDCLMANTRNNPIEELEWRFPMRTERYELRVQPVSQMVEVPETRAEAARLCGLGDRVLQHMFRIGHAQPDAVRTDREPLASLIVRTDGRS